MYASGPHELTSFNIKPTFTLSSTSNALEFPIHHIIKTEKNLCTLNSLNIRK